MTNNKNPKALHRYALTVRLTEDQSRLLDEVVSRRSAESFGEPVSRGDTARIALMRGLNVWPTGRVLSDELVRTSSVTATLPEALSLTSLESTIDSTDQKHLRRRYRLAREQLSISEIAYGAKVEVEDLKPLRKPSLGLMLSKKVARRLDRCLTKHGY